MKTAEERNPYPIPRDEDQRPGDQDNRRIFSTKSGSPGLLVLLLLSPQLPGGRIVDGIGVRCREGQSQYRTEAKIKAKIEGSKGSLRDPSIL
jgi:hypothetical protein